MGTICTYELCVIIVIWVSAYNKYYIIVCSLGLLFFVPPSEEKLKKILLWPWPKSRTNMSLKIFSMYIYKNSSVFSRFYIFWWYENKLCMPSKINGRRQFTFSKLFLYWLVKNRWKCKIGTQLYLTLNSWEYPRKWKRDYVCLIMVHISFRLLLLLFLQET